MVKTTGSSELLATGVLRADNNEVVWGGGGRVDETVKNLSKSKKSKNPTKTAKSRKSKNLTKLSISSQRSI